LTFYPLSYNLWEVVFGDFTGSVDGYEKFICRLQE